jgi:hypothetical protein
MHGDQIVALVGAVYILHSEAEEENSFVLICQEAHCCRRNFRRMAVEAVEAWYWDLMHFDNGLKMSLAMLVLPCSLQCSVSHSCYKTIHWELVLSHIVGRFYFRYSF